MPRALEHLPPETWRTSCFGGFGPLIIECEAYPQLVGGAAVKYLSKITVNAWAEALRNPDMHKQAYRFYNETHKTLAKFAELWQSEGLVSADAAAAIADLFIALMPGMLVIRHLYKPATAARLADGIVAFAGSGD